MRSTSTYTYLFLTNICFLAAFLMMSDTMVGNIFAVLFLSTAAIFMITASLIFLLPDPELSATHSSEL